MHGSRMRLSTLVILSCAMGTHWSEAKCHTFMGLSSCTDDNSDGNEFSLGWWLVNVNSRINHIRKINDWLEGTLVGDFLNRDPHTAEIWTLVRSDSINRFFQSAVDYLGNKGAPLDLLYDESANAEILHQSSRKHNREIVDFIKELLDNAALEHDVRAFALSYVTYMDRSHVVRSLGPDITQTPTFKLLLRSALASIK